MISERTMLDLASRNDGFMVEATNNPSLDALRRAGLVYTRPAGAEGYVVVRAVQEPPRRSCYRSPRLWARAAEIGAVVA